MEEKTCFGKCLLDMSFEKLITASIVKILYPIGIAGAVLTGIYILVKAFGQKLGPGLLYVAAAFIIPVLVIVAVRIALELVLTLFRIEENTRTPATAETAPVNTNPVTTADEPAIDSTPQETRDE